MSKIGVRREDKHRWERRVPLTPDAVRQLVAAGHEVIVQPSTIRIFDDASYLDAGAIVADDLSEADVVFAVKEIPEILLREGGAYVFFSHTIKGQPHNMPLLKRIMELGCTLYDYERIVNEKGRRLVFFGRHAGLAGMVDTLAVYGRRFPDSPFAALELAHEYEDLEAAKSAIRAIDFTPDRPFVVGFAGYGNVSQGAQAIFDLLEPKTITPDQLPITEPGIYKVVFEEKHLVEPTEGEFVLQDYYDHPERYRSIFEKHAPHLSILINAIYWTEAYPRLLSTDYLKNADLPLAVIGDISCDLDGAVQCTVKATTPGEPAYVYEPKAGTVTDGVEGDGIVMMTTDCLPCELPKESSSSFTEALMPFVGAIADADLTKSFDEAELPPEIRSATIVWRGELTPDYRYLAAHLDAD